MSELLCAPHYCKPVWIHTQLRTSTLGTSLNCSGKSVSFPFLPSKPAEPNKGSAKTTAEHSQLVIPVMQ